MISLRPANQRGFFDYGWLKTYHTFSFNEYHDPHHVHFHTLRVINQDTIAPDSGFGLHSHRDMEIITYPIRGTITHEDSMGNKTEITADEVQLMSAGTGVQHSEHNRSKTEELELLQIWIFPDKKGLTPSYQQMRFEKTASHLRLLASPNGEKDSLKIHQNVKLFDLALKSGEQQKYSLTEGHHAWIQVIHGSLLLLNRQHLNAGDGAAISSEQQLQFNALDNCALLLFDLGLPHEL